MSIAIRSGDLSWLQNYLAHSFNKAIYSKNGWMNSTFSTSGYLILNIDYM